MDQGSGQPGRGTWPPQAPRGRPTTLGESERTAVNQEGAPTTGQRAPSATPASGAPALEEHGDGAHHRGRGELDAARSLLCDDTLRWESGRAVLTDVGLRHDADDVFLISDLDEGGFLERYSLTDPSTAPEGHSLIQSTMPLRPGESRTEGLGRLERLLDLGAPHWRERVTWRRDAVAAGRSGALDLPGTTWRDRPAIAHADGVYLAGDSVAAPGLLGEVSMNSAVQAVELALAHGTARVTHRAGG